LSIESRTLGSCLLLLACPWLARGESIERYETERVTKDGHRILISVTMCPMRNRDDAIIGYSEMVQEELEDDSECEVAFQTLGIYPSNSHINY